MDWALVWSWTLTAAKWSFYAVLAYFSVRWWVRSQTDSAKLRFMDAKIDALLEQFDTGFYENFRERVATILHASGEYAAKTEYVVATGASWTQAEEFIRDLLDESEEAKAQESESAPLNVDADELHRLVDQVFQPHKKPRRTSLRQR
jgi:hypothetical protein